MRWLAWLFTGTTCLAGCNGPLPEIKVGTSQRELEVHAVSGDWNDGANPRAFLVGTVTEVAAEEDRQPQRIRLSESCTLNVDAAYGCMDQVAGIQTAVLKAGYEQSPYVPIDEDWGRLWHFKKGQKLLVILHPCDGEPCFVPDELMALDERTTSLPEILRRTTLLPEKFTDADLEVLRLASLSLHQQFFAATAAEREESRRRRDAMLKAAGICALVAAGIWGLRKARK